MGMLGFGSRFNQAANAGFLAGLAVDLNARDLAFSLKIEGRKQAGGFRQGMVGPAYELSRFAGIGLTGVPLAQEMLPDTFSLYGETRVKVNELVSVDAMVEHFAFGRTDFDATVNVNSPQQWVVVGARFTAVGMGVAPRFAVTANTRIRLFKSFYVLASGGTIFFPQADGSLNRGVTFSAGAGVDFER